MLITEFYDKVVEIFPLPKPNFSNFYDLFSELIKNGEVTTTKERVDKLVSELSNIKELGFIDVDVFKYKIKVPRSEIFNLIKFMFSKYPEASLLLPKEKYESIKEILDELSTYNKLPDKVKKEDGKLKTNIEKIFFLGTIYLKLPIVIEKIKEDTGLVLRIHFWVNGTLRSINVSPTKLIVGIQEGLLQNFNILIPLPPKDISLQLTNTLLNTCFVFEDLKNTVVDFFVDLLRDKIRAEGLYEYKKGETYDDRIYIDRIKNEILIPNRKIKEMYSSHELFSSYIDKNHTYSYLHLLLHKSGVLKKPTVMVVHRGALRNKKIDVKEKSKIIIVDLKYIKNNYDFFLDLEGYIKEGEEDEGS